MSVRMPTFVFSCAAILLGVAPPALADEALGAASRSGAGVIALAIAFGIGLAVLGGTLGQSRVVSSALEGIGRNPSASEKFFVPLILGLALIESLVLVGWVLMYMLLAKI